MGAILHQLLTGGHDGQLFGERSHKSAQMYDSAPGDKYFYLVFFLLFLFDCCTQLRISEVQNNYFSGPDFYKENSFIRLKQKNGQKFHKAVVTPGVKFKN